MRHSALAPLCVAALLSPQVHGAAAMSFDDFAISLDKGLPLALGVLVLVVVLSAVTAIYCTRGEVRTEAGPTHRSGGGGYCANARQGAGTREGRSTLFCFHARAFSAAPPRRTPWAASRPLRVSLACVTPTTPD